MTVEMVNVHENIHNFLDQFNLAEFKISFCEKVHTTVLPLASLETIVLFHAVVPSTVACFLFKYYNDDNKLVWADPKLCLWFLESNEY